MLEEALRAVKGNSCPTHFFAAGTSHDVRVLDKQTAIR